MAKTKEKELTPMRKQYLEIKRAEPGLPFCSSGWAIFMRCSTRTPKLASKELDLTLTTRDRGKPKEERAPMCGVPYHSYQSLSWPGSSPRATRWPSASRSRIPPRPRGW